MSKIDSLRCLWTLRAGSSVGGALPLQGRGHGFEPRSAYHSIRYILRGRSSAWLERLPVTQEVASSSLVDPAIYLLLFDGERRRPFTDTFITLWTR